MVGIKPDHGRRLARVLAQIDRAEVIENLNEPHLRLHKLVGRQDGRWSVRINWNWRLTFEFHEGDVYELDYEDYH